MLHMLYVAGTTSITPVDSIGNEPKIENGKLYFDRKW